MLPRLPLVTLLSTLIATAAGANYSVGHDTVVTSPGDPGVTVTYRQQSQICTAAFEAQKQYTGWVNIPPSSSASYPTNLFFWFVEAREPTTSLTIWLNGGPGTSSLYGFFTSNGPCEVFEIGLAEYETRAREWGWDRASNMLFIDQPNQVGFSYDKPTNATLYVPEEQVLGPSDLEFYDELLDGFTLAPDWAFLNGTFSSANTINTANTTETAAMATWHLLQGFLGAFPQYLPPAHGPMDINLFAESYGGVYGPIFAETFQEQNQKRLAGVLSANATLELRLASLGLINGCVDPGIETPLYPLFASENTYGYETLSQVEVEYYVASYDGPDGCRELLERCQEAASQIDPEGEGDDSEVNHLCNLALLECDEIKSAGLTDFSAYDLSAPKANPFPPYYFLDYLNLDATLRALGSPVNYTVTSQVVNRNYVTTGDMARGGNIERLAALLNSGVRIGLVYGDRDYICNWFGGEAVSKAIAEAAGGSYAESFNAAGYAPIIVNDSYIGGSVRQFANLSFSRVYQAGHAVAAYQPETAFQIFARIVNGNAISTGAEADLTQYYYATEGPANSTETDDLPPPPEPKCFVRKLNETCGDDFRVSDQFLINGVLYEDEEDWPLVSHTIRTTTAASTTAATETVPLTGVYTATETPDSAGSRGLDVALIGVLGIVSAGACVVNAL